MVLSYLEKLQEEYLEEKSGIDRECEKLQLCLKENVEFIKLLEETNDPNYESFTPRDVNTKNKEKISELQNEQKEIKKNLELKETYRDACAAKIDELTDVLAAAKEMRDESEKINSEFAVYRASLSEMQEQERQHILGELNDSIVQKMTGLVHRTELCNRLVELDQNRCKLELGIISKTMNEIICDIQKMIDDLTSDDI